LRSDLFWMPLADPAVNDPKFLIFSLLVATVQPTQDNFL
jgi:hypothetical protein